MHNTVETQHLDELKKMSTQQLDEILRSDLMCEDCSDYERVCLILSILEEREKDMPIPKEAHVDAAWKQFQEYYNTPSGKGKSLYSCELPTDTACCPKKKNAHLWYRVVATAAVLCLLLTVVPPAFGAENIFTLIAEWTESIFHFSSSGGSPTEPNVEQEYCSENSDLMELYVTMTAYSQGAQVVPTWIPDGLSMDELTVKERPDSIRILAAFSSGEDELLLTYTVNLSRPDSGFLYEKQEDDVKEILISGIRHYLFKNEGQYMCGWVTGNIECAIGGDISESDMVTIINSIYGG